MTRTVFTGGRVFDGTGAPLAEADVVIEDGRIVEVGPELDGDGAVECSGKALLPGLFDVHVHLAFAYEDFDEVRVMNEPFSLRFYKVAENMRRTIALGITTVRDASGADAGMKAAVEQGLLLGPRMQISVTMVAMTGGHSDPWLPSGARGAWGTPYPGMPDGVCDGVEGVAVKVREVVRAGADVIKIASSGGFLSPVDDPRQPNSRPRNCAGGMQERVGGRVNSRDRGGPRPLGDVARPRHRGHQARRPRRRALDRPWHVPRRRGDRAHARARDLARADAHRR